jgi:hypothetical protein
VRKGNVPRSKKAADPETPEAPETLDEEPELPEVAEIPEAEVAAPAPSGRKALGGKEVIPFKWKLLAVADGLTLTLFKAVEREDVEAQLDRLRNEAYYSDLRIVGIEEKITQAKDAKAKLLRERSDHKDQTSSTASARGNKKRLTKTAEASAATSAKAKATANSNGKAASPGTVKLDRRKPVAKAAKAAKKAAKKK